MYPVLVFVGDCPLQVTRRDGGFRESGVIYPTDQAGIHCTESTSILAGNRVEPFGAPAQGPPTAKFRIANIGRLYTHVEPGASDAGVNVPSVVPSTPKVISSTRCRTQKLW